MNCDLAQRSLSALADGEPPDADGAAVAAHLDGCDDCRAFDATVRSVRQRLRFEPVGPLPDLTTGVLARLSTERTRRRLPTLAAVAAAVVVGAVAGASFVGLGTAPRDVAAADLPTRVLEVQPAVTTLSATVTVREAGGREWRGTLAYRAPESLAVLLTAPDATVLATVADGDRWWATWPRRCAPPAPGACALTTTRVVERRAPFADDAAAPLELVSPVDSLVASATPHALGRRDIAGRAAIGIRVPAAQVAEVLRGLDPNGALRPVHPTDEVELWLDEAQLVPLELVVLAGSSPERLRWAAAAGLTDRAGDTVLEVHLADVVFDAPLPDGAFPPPPADGDHTDGGFVEGGADDAPVPADLPAGLEPGRSGTVGPVGVRSWSDGRAWLVVRATRSWPGGRLFGGVGQFVVPLDLGEAGTAYAAADGAAVALHGDGTDVVVRGNVGVDVLRRAAASLGVVGRVVPEDWSESATATITEAHRAAPDLLVLDDLDGFGPPAVRIDGSNVTIRYVGAGDRAVEIVRSELTLLPPPIKLTPPSDPDVVAVDVRGTTGRYVGGTGDLEWVEAGHVRVLRGAALTRDELVALADGLRPA